MEKYDKLIETDNRGLHCILFSNRDALDINTIENKFSQFGKVCEVKLHNDLPRGICFVRYKFKDDAIRAVDQLENDQEITLKEHNRKKLKGGYNAERSQGSDHGQNLDGTKFIQQFSRQMKQENHKSGYNRNGDYKENCNMQLPWGANSGTGNQNQNEQPWRPNEYKRQNDVSQAQKSPTGHQKKNDTFQGPNDRSRYQGTDDGIPDLVDRNKRTMVEIQNQSSEVPELVTANGKTFTASNPVKKQIIIAEEVIVANIHPKYGAPYILHLFDRFEPLAITNIMVEPKTGKRYCHVYFKSAKESQEAERFDKYELSNQKLVVIRSNRLVETAYFK